MNVEFKRNKSGEVTVVFKGMTQGKALALCHALAEHARNSPVGEDLKIALHIALHKAGKTDQDQELFEATGQ